MLIQAGLAQKPSTATTAFAPDIPKTWDDTAMRDLEVPLADPKASPKHVPAEYYYRIPVRPIYKSHPVYAPGHEPPGYIEKLKQQEPVVIWDDGGHQPPLQTEANWIKAGETVFDAPIFYDAVTTALWVRDSAWYDKSKPRLTKDGTLPFARYVIRKKGKVELGNNACGFCHTRVMPDGSVIKGAQGSFAFDRSNAFRVRAGFAEAKDEAQFAQQLRLGVKNLLAAPWLYPDPQVRLVEMTPEEQASVLEGIPPGVLARTGTSAFFPPQAPDLIGVKERHYLDHTGPQHHRSIADLMRYAALNNEMDRFDRFDDFIPGGEDFRKLPDPKTVLERYSNEQLYALALYLYSVQPPPTPNKFDDTAARGQKVFEREGCAGCHTPLLYTNNMLTPAEGFTPPEDHLKKYDVLPIPVGTDPSLTMKTRRGTGYYKVSSLKGVWYRSMFGHNGWCAALEDWFDPRRLHDDYVPTGFKPYGVKTFAVKGHDFGLNLPADDKKALLAFLRTL